MGAIRERLYQNDEIFQYLFGSKMHKDAKGYQSHFIIDDLKCVSEEIRISIRDGVRIDHQSNLAKNQSKYEYELLEPAHDFEFFMEITVREIEINKKIPNFIHNIYNLLKNDAEPLQVGSLTSFGFGQLELKNFEWTDLLSGLNYFKFLSNKSDTDLWKNFVSVADTTSSKFISFNLDLIPTTPLFIGGGEVNIPDADDASLNYKGKYILSAKSMKGAIRHHAYRIANTVHGEETANQMCNEIFGNIDEKVLTKSNFWLSDADIKNSDKQNSQARVAIDRFTGGAIKSALFATEPVWPKKETTVSINWKLKIDEIEKDSASIGLLILVARDLMTEMLSIGGDKSIGRGRFRGDKLEIKGNEIKIEYKFEESKNNEDDVNNLDKYIKSFLKKKI
jgi:CRISPR/Cas system CSM-associated protein Csm3 (group 7 of RAMP superfamily)